jgi:alpha-glucosidase
MVRILQVLLTLIPCALFSQSREFKVVSPNKEIIFSLTVNKESPLYTVAFHERNIIQNSSLSLDFKDLGHFGSDLKGKSLSLKNKTEKYTLVVGKTKNVNEKFNELVIELAQTKSPFLKIHLIVKVFDDAVAFRYEFPKQHGIKNIDLADENSTFAFTSNPTVYALFREKYTTSHEGLYTKIRLDSIKENTLMDMPVLFQLDNACISITEAALLNYAGMYLSKTSGTKLVSKLSPLPDQPTIKVRTTAPFHSPWRVIMVADKVGKLIESNILTNLNENSKIADWSWLKSGKTDFPWWNGDVIKDVDFEIGLNYETHKHYIDFCAASHIDFHTIVSYGNFAWYQGETEGFNPSSPNADVTKPVEALQMEKLAGYSRQKGVGLRVWVNWKALDGKLDKAFSQFQKWNIQGLMVDFMDRDDQEMVNFVEDVLKTAAKYHLHIQFHGAYKPTGLSRMYPNELTKEGVLNLEVSKWNADVNPEHNLIVPFTRMLAGPMDYHAGGFRSVTREAFVAKGSEPNVMGTRCHHLAMPIVYESYLQMICDYPEAYKNQLGFEFLCQVPTTWDETKVLNAQVGDFLTIARRKGNDWYIGTMNDWTPRKLTIDLSFLPEGSYLADLYEDAPDAAADPNHLTKQTVEVNSKSVLPVNLATGGGQAIWIRRKK